MVEIHAKIKLRFEGARAAVSNMKDHFISKDFSLSLKIRLIKYYIWCGSLKPDRFTREKTGDIRNVGVSALSSYIPAPI